MKANIDEFCKGLTEDAVNEDEEEYEEEVNDNGDGVVPRSVEGFLELAEEVEGDIRREPEGEHDEGDHLR